MHYTLWRVKSSELIRYLRETQGMSQGKLSYLLQIKQQRISEYECGEKIPSGDRLLRIIEMLGAEVRIKG